MPGFPAVQDGARNRHYKLDPELESSWDRFRAAASSILLHQAGASARPKAGLGSLGTGCRYSDELSEFLGSSLRRELETLDDDLHLLVVLALSWRWEWIGGILFPALGGLYLVTCWGRFHWSAYLIIAGPLFLVGTLFLLSWRQPEPSLTPPLCVSHASPLPLPLLRRRRQTHHRVPGFGDHTPVAASPAPLLPDLRGEVVPQPQDQAGGRQQVEQPEHEDFSFRHAPVIAGSRREGKDGRGSAQVSRNPSVAGELPAPRHTAVGRCRIGLGGHKP